MKRDVKKTAFSRASIFIFGRLSYVTALGNILFGTIFNASDVMNMCSMYCNFVLCYIIGSSLQCCLFGELSGLTSNSLFFDPFWAIMKL